MLRASLVQVLSVIVGHMAYYVSHMTALWTLGALAAQRGKPTLGGLQPNTGSGTAGRPQKSTVGSGTAGSLQDPSSRQSSIARQPSITRQPSIARQSSIVTVHALTDDDFNWLKYSRTKSLDDASIASAGAERDLFPALSSILGCDAHGIQVDVLVSPQASRHRSAFLVPHQWKATLPPGSFIWLTPELRVNSPEFCFLQMAGQLPMDELVQLGYSICGTYQLANIPKGFIERCALTTVDRLDRYLKNAAPNTPGIDKARKALAHIIDGSNSPLETCGAMELVLPGVLGGLQVVHPILNARVDLSQEAQQLSGLSWCVVDALWPNANFALELLGAEYHADTTRDTKRLLGLEHDGFVVRELTAEQVRQPNHMAEIARQIKTSMGVQPSYRPPSDRVLQRREDLVSSLFPPGQRGPGGAIVYPKPKWALPENFTVCIEEERKHSQLKRRRQP